MSRSKPSQVFPEETATGLSVLESASQGREQLLEIEVRQWLDAQFAALRPADPAIQQLCDDATSLSVNSAASREFATTLHKDLKRRRENWVSQIKDIKVRIDALKAPVLALEKKELARYDNAILALTTRCSAFDQEQERKRREENEKRIREAEAKARAEQAAAVAAAKAEADRLKAAANKAAEDGDPVEAEQLWQEKKEAAARAKWLASAEPETGPIILEEAPKLDNQHYRDNWEVEITDFSAIPQKFKDEAMNTQEFHDIVHGILLALAKKQRTLFSQPGCKATNRRKLITKAP